MNRFVIAFFLALFGFCSAGVAQEEETPLPPPPSLLEGLTIDLTKLPPPPPKQVTERFVRTPFLQALRRLFEATEPPTDYHLEIPPTTGMVTLDLEQEPLDSALEKLLNQVSARVGYRSEHGEYFIIPRDPRGEANLTPRSQRPGVAAPAVRTAVAVTSGEDEALTVFDPNIRPPLVVQSGHAERIIAVAFSPDGRLVASGGDENTTNLWSMASRKLLHTFPGRLQPNPFTDNGKTLVTVTGDRIYYWSTATGEPIRTFSAHRPTARSVALVPVGNTTTSEGPVVTSGNENWIRYWTGPARQKGRREWNTPYANCDVRLSGNGRWIAAFVVDSFALPEDASEDDKRFKSSSSKLMLFHLNQPRRKDRYELNIKQEITDVAFQPGNNSPYVAIATNNSVIQLWNYQTQKLIKTFVCSPDQKYDEPGNVNPVLTREGRSFTTCAWSPDGRYLAGSGDGGVIVVWEAETRRRRHTLRGHRVVVRPVGQKPYRIQVSASALAFSPDGRRLLSGASWQGSSPEKLIVWNLGTGRPDRTFNNTVRDFLLVDFNADASKIIASGYQETRLWDTGMLHKPRTLPATAPVLLSPDRKLLAGRDRTEGLARPNPVTGETMAPMGPGVTLWETGQGNKVRTLHPTGTTTGEVASLAFAPDGKVAFAGGWDNPTIHRWDVATGEPLPPLTEVHSAPVIFLACTGDGKYLVSQDRNNLCAVWDISTGEPLHRFGVLSKSQGKAIPSYDPGSAPLPSGVTRAERPFSPFSNNIVEMVVSPNPTGQPYLAVYDGGGVSVYELLSGRHLWRSAGFSPRFFPDGSRVVLGNADDARFYFTESGKPDTALRSTGRLKGGGNLTQFSDIGGFIATRGLSESIDKVTVYWPRRLFIRLEGHMGTIQALGISPDGTRLVTGGRDSTVRLWNIPAAYQKKGQKDLEMAAFIGVDEEDYIVCTPDNHYMATKNALKKVTFRIGEVPFPFEQFDIQLNRPDKVLTRLGKAPASLISTYARAQQKRLTRMGLTDAVLARKQHLPSIAVTTSIPDTTFDGSLEIGLRAKDTQYPIRSLNVYVNDVPIFGSGGKDVSERGQRILEEAVPVALMRGRNKIQVSATNTQGVESRQLTYELYCASPRLPNPVLHVVTVGVSHYRSPELATLPLASKDASDLAIFLNQLGPAIGWQASAPEKPTPARNAPRLPGGRTGVRGAARVTPPTATVEAPDDSVTDYGKRYAGVRIHPPLLNEEATRDNIRKVRTFLEQTAPEDHVIVFFAGHGLLERDTADYYFCTTETDPNNLSSTALNYYEIERLLDGIPARQKLVLLDTCHSGEVDRSEALRVRQATPGSTVARADGTTRRGLLFLDNAPSTAFELMQEAFADLRRGSGAQVISAAGGTQSALEDRELGNGVFTYCLLQGLRRRSTGIYADLDNDARVTISELREYVTEQVQKLTNGDQKPASRQENIEFDFPILVLPQ